jgi:hypothetical protein
MTRNATPDERADHDRDLRKHDPGPNLYDVKCVAYPRPIERVYAETSFDARQTYAEKHGRELTDVIAVRVRHVREDRRI